MAYIAMIKERESNMELLRIIAMLFIVFHHFIVHAICPDVLYAQGVITPLFITSSIFEGFLYVGVNCFLLISGYFGIRLRVGKIWTFYLQCSFYFLLGYLFAYFYEGMPITHKIITGTIFPFSHSIYWFVPQFLILMLLSPILNVGISKLSKRQYINLLIGLTFLQVVLGFFWQCNNYDSNGGYNAMHFIYIYIIGGYIRNHCRGGNWRHHRYLYLIIYMGFALIWAGCNILRLYTNIPYGLNYGYNNPLVICASIALFQFISSFSIYSKWVNYAGGGVFAAYLIQDQNYIGIPLYAWWGNLCGEMRSDIIVFASTILLSIVLLLSAIFVEKLRLFVMKPIFSIFDMIDKKMADRET